MCVEKTITKDILKNELYAGPQPAFELLYARYSGMLFSYILQFIPDRTEAGKLLVEIFSRLTPRLQQAFESSLSIYCWLQVEGRKIILEHQQSVRPVQSNSPAVQSIQVDSQEAVAPDELSFYCMLLAEASPEHQWIFREVFIRGRKKEDLAERSGKDMAYISSVLRECLLLIRKNLG